MKKATFLRRWSAVLCVYLLLVCMVPTYAQDTVRQSFGFKFFGLHGSNLCPGYRPSIFRIQVYGQPIHFCGGFCRWVQQIGHGYWYASMSDTRITDIPKSSRIPLNIGFVFSFSSLN